MLLMKKRFIVLTFIFLVLIIMYNNFLIVNRLLFKMRLDLEERQLNLILPSFVDNQTTQMIIESTNSWISNNLIAQYSSKVVIKSENMVMLEAIVLYDNPNQQPEYIRSNVKFLVHLGAERVFLSADEVYAKEYDIEIDKSRRYIWKLRANLNAKNLIIHLESLSFLVTDFQEYQKLFFTFFDDLNRILVFHKPIVYDSRKPKKRAVAHCVHQVRGLNEEKTASNMISWLKLQKDIGIERVKLYFNHGYEDGIRVLKKFESEKFIELVDYRFDLETICKNQLKFQASKPRSFGSNYSLNLCKRIYSIYFESRWETFHTHEMTATNDCFTNFKYTHQYVTNYDFDELIFPRKWDFNASNLTCDLSISNPIKYNIYDYASRLFGIYRKDSKQPIGAVHFEHFLLVDHISQEFLVDIMKPFNDNRTLSRLVKLTYEKKNIRFSVEKGDINENEISKSISLIKCLNKTMGREDSLRKWNRVYALWINVRHGKSIYDTDYTEFVNQHYAELLSENAKWISLPITDGFSSHFRDPVDNNFFLGQTYKFKKHFHIELEYFYFLAYHASKYYSSFLRNFLN